MAVGLLSPATVLIVAVAPGATVAAAPPTSAYVPLPVAQRLVDTRQSGALGPGGTITVGITGATPRPAPGTATAAVLNVTVPAPAGVGFWTVWPHGAPRPEASNLNVDELQSLTGTVTANLVTVPVGADGAVDVYTKSGGNVVVDLLGYYTPAATATAGRFTPLAAPSRVMDTRGAATFRPGEARRFTIPGAAGATAAAINLTSVTVNRGFWQVYAAGGATPTTSNLNSPAGFGAVNSNQAIVGLDATGSITIFSQNGGDLIVDLVGTYTGATAPAGTAGLFVPVRSPTRIVDTRVAALNPLGGTTRPQPGWSFEVPVATHAAIRRSDVSAVVLNATAADTLRTGFITVGTAGATKPGTAPTTSTMNIRRPAQRRANHAIVPVSGRGFSMYTQAGGNLIADLAGYFVGSAAAAPHGKPANVSAPGCFTGTAGYAGAPVGPIVLGSSAKAVADLQRRLLELGFWNAGADGSYGLSTTQAVMAFQKWRGLPATTVVDDATAQALNLQVCRPAAGGPGNMFEVDKGTQVAYVVRNGLVQYVFNVSTGNGERYTEPNQKYGGTVSGVADTPNGTFRTYREHDIARYEGDLGTLYRPKFFNGGVAVHGAPRVPNYPASHGCVRVANPVMDLIWGENLLPLRSTVWVHD